MTERKPAWGEEKSEAPKEFAHVTSLGHFQHAWKPVGTTVQSATVILILGAIMGAIGGAMVLGSGSPLAFLPFGTFGLIFFPLGVVMILQRRGTASQAATYNQGFAALVGKTVSLWPWDEITAITFKDRYVTGKRVSWTNHQLEVTKRGGESVLVTSDLEDVVGLIDTIKSHVSKKLLQPLQTAYDAGQTLSFGPITVSKHVIEGPGHRFDWTAVRNVVMKNGWLVVTPKDGKPFEMRTEKIPNVDLLCQVIGVKYSALDLAYYFGAPR